MKGWVWVVDFPYLWLSQRLSTCDVRAEFTGLIADCIGVARGGHDCKGVGRRGLIVDIFCFYLYRFDLNGKGLGCTSIKWLIRLKV